MNVPDALAGRLQMNEPLRRHSYIGIGGRALYYAAVRTVAELAAARQFAADGGWPLFVIGMGTNVLVADQGVDGLVAVLEGDDFDGCRAGDGTLDAAAGCSLARAMNTAVAAGLAGLEVLAGIPSTVGGALWMNAGGRHGTVTDRLETVTVMDPLGAVRACGRDELAFGYRQSSFAEGTIILGARFKCERVVPEMLAVRRDAILADKARTQPLDARSLGCVFRNPAGRSAGELIDRCGLKGTRVGDMAVSTLHANFIVNAGQGRSRDMVALMELIHARVREAHGVDLAPEIVFFGDCGWTHGSVPAACR
ncbi:MAG: UDP-N-acetylmuramate dehydrogenase [Planctomycetota bacterium]